MTTADVLAEQFYLVVMQATADTWLTWENVPQAERSGYYDLAHEVAEKVDRPVRTALQGQRDTIVSKIEDAALHVLSSGGSPGGDPLVAAVLRQAAEIARWVPYDPPVAVCTCSDMFGPGTIYTLNCALHSAQAARTRRESSRPGDGDA